MRKRNCSSTAQVRRLIIRPSPNGFETYGTVDANVRFNYQSIGSGGGIKNLLNQTVDFGASDAPMKDEALGTAPGKILHIPIVAGGVAIIYNLPGNPKLKLDGDTPANIYLGNIIKWNDPKIAALNSEVSLPDTTIVPVHRADGSGTSFIFTDYLSSVNPAWADTVGKGSSVKWPAGIGLAAKGSEGVAGQVKQLPGGIGYAELAYADQNRIPFADMKNSSGNRLFRPRPIPSTSAALATANIPGRLPLLDGQRARRKSVSDFRRKLGAGLSKAKGRGSRRKTRRVFEMGGHRGAETFTRARLRAIAGRSPAKRELKTAL